MLKKKIFKLPYIGVEDSDNTCHLLLGAKGEISSIIKINNTVLQYAADPDRYMAFHHSILQVIKIIGEGHTVQKLDIFSKDAYKGTKSKEYLQQKYDEHFEGRICSKITTYLIITLSEQSKLSGKRAAKRQSAFIELISKVAQVLDASGFAPSVLRKKEIDRLVLQVLSMNFKSGTVSLDNIKPSDTHIKMGANSVRCLSLIDIDRIDLPDRVSPYIERNDNEAVKGFPIDSMSFLYNTPGYEAMVYNQVIEIPKQVQEIQRLQTKSNRHKGIPDPENEICVKDIQQLLEDIARDNQLLVNAHFSVIVKAADDKLKKVVNSIENDLFQQGIIASQNSYNQLELFRAALPGNAVELKGYDKYLTTSDAALTFLFKEALPISEPAPKGFSIRFADRQGIPVAIDPADYSRDIGRINNRNKFVLGPSGSGKSFFMNALLEQYLLYNMDVVIVDTGDSYSGLSSYLNGKYITWKDDEPITMNPFVITKEEYNLEKKDFLVTLVGLLWKGAEGVLSQVESDVINDVVTAYYENYFDDKDRSITGYARDKEGGQFNVGTQCFNSFYEFAVFLIPHIEKKENIQFNFYDFRYVLRKFYKGGTYEKILNEQADTSLFGERLIVFEIDNIKQNKILFPIVTLIIMDVFIQKMRFRQQQRKALIIEEAWKAIASPLMANYILYLYKTVRKFNGEAIVVTQELDDIIGNAVVKNSIVNNSDTVCLLDQTKFKDDYAAISNLLSINEVERKKIFTINNLDNKENRSVFKEVYIRRGPVGEVYGAEVSFCQYLTYTTEKPEKLAVETYVRALGSYPKGLELFVAHLKKSGVSFPAFVMFINAIGRIVTDTAFDILNTYKEKYGHDAVTRLQKDLSNGAISLPQIIGSTNSTESLNCKTLKYRLQ